VNPGNLGRRRWRKVAFLGCAGFVLLTAMVVVSVASFLRAHWTEIESVFLSGKKELAEVMAVQRAIETKYKASYVYVNEKYPSGAKQRILTVQIENPAFPMSKDGDIRRQQALEVAVTARNALPVQGTVSAYEVFVIRRTGLGVTRASTDLFTFTPTELPSPQPEAGQ
jgi:hypothetical protein